MTICGAIKILIEMIDDVGCYGGNQPENQAVDMAISALMEKGESDAKDSAIKRMAEFISTFDTDESICKHEHEGISDCEAEGFNCVECIIKHFSNSVEI